MTKIKNEELEAALGLIDFIDASPTAFQAVDEEKAILAEAGFEELLQEEKWELKKGGSYFVEIGGASLVAFRLSRKATAPFNIIGSHNDSPTYQVKENSLIKKEGCLLLNVEPYGGMIHRSWLDRPLSLAGRIIIKDDDQIDGLAIKKVKIEKPLMIIPSLAIHMNRDVNSNGEIRPQKAMLPLIGLESKLTSEIDGGDFDDTFNSDSENSDIIKHILSLYGDCEYDKILDYDLFLYDLDGGKIVGFEDEFISVGRLDNLACSHAAVIGLINAEPAGVHQLISLHDNEEVGSRSRRGANSQLLRDILHRIYLALGQDREDFYSALAQSLMISCDMAHAVHPSYPEMADPTNRPRLNAGPVIKYSANKRYSSEAEGVARIRLYAEKAGIPLQTFHNHSDKKGGSTIGAMSEQWTTITNVDIGNPLLAMHSVRELAGVKDHIAMIKLLTAFFEG